SSDAFTGLLKGEPTLLSKQARKNRHRRHRDGTPLPLPRQVSNGSCFRICGDAQLEFITTARIIFVMRSGQRPGWCVEGALQDRVFCVIKYELLVQGV